LDRYASSLAVLTNEERDGSASEVIQIGCPLRVKFGSLGAQLGSPLYPQEQTSSAGPSRIQKVP
jgi:hypothetical protein